MVPFMETLESPIIVANIDDVDEPTFQGKYQPSIVIDRYGRKIGVIGVILSTVDVSLQFILSFALETRGLLRFASICSVVFYCLSA